MVLLRDRICVCGGRGVRGVRIDSFPLSLSLHIPMGRALTTRGWGTQRLVKPHGVRVRRMAVSRLCATAMRHIFHCNQPGSCPRG